MKAQIKSDQEIELMRIGGKILAETLEYTLSKSKPGISTYELDKIAEEYIRSKNATPSFKGYQGFPATLCTAINNVIVHGIPRKDEILKEGDLFTIDCGVLYKGFHTDAARTIGIGKIDSQKEQLISVVKKALKEGIKVATPGTMVNQIGKVIQNIAEKNGYHIIYDLTGHGVGKNLHEEPTILNYWDKKYTDILKPGMTIAIEPIISIGTSDMKTLSDNWTLVTSDGSLAIQQEETILITENGNEILTKL